METQTMGHNCSDVTSTQALIINFTEPIPAAQLSIVSKECWLLTLALSSQLTPVWSSVTNVETVVSMVAQLRLMCQIGEWVTMWPQQRLQKNKISKNLHHDITILTSPWLHPDFILTSPWLHPDFTLTSSWLHPDLIFDHIHRHRD